ncbi:MAG: BON domain-containing protein [Desulfobacterales bacterium]
MARTDELIKKDIIDQMARDDRVNAAKVNVEVSNGTVTLRGEVPTYFARSAAYDDALGTLGVTYVRNQLLVTYPPSVSLPTDLEIEDNIREKISANPDLDLIDVDVNVSAGTVTLKGTVDAYWKKIHAENLVASEPGVILIENHLAVVPTDDIVDISIAEDIVDTLESRSAVDADDVNVRVRNGAVTLTGSVPSWSARKAAEEAAVYTAGVKDVINRIAILG